VLERLWGDRPSHILLLGIQNYINLVGENLTISNKIVHISAFDLATLLQEIVLKDTLEKILKGQEKAIN
jgi:hypothetical protein